jgi:cytidine deaminase
METGMSTTPRRLPAAAARNAEVESKRMTLSEKDLELITAATEAIKTRYRNDWQEVGAALRTRDGRVVTGVNLDAYVGRGAVCAEAVAIGRAITETGDKGIETIVAVRHPKPGEPGGVAVVSPCGTCRELIHDYDDKARVIVPDGNGQAVLTIAELLPNKYRRGMT